MPPNQIDLITTTAECPQGTRLPAVHRTAGINPPIKIDTWKTCFPAEKRSVQSVEYS